MFKYSAKSQAQLNTCHKDLKKIFGVVLMNFDHTIIEGHRDEDRQNQLKKEGKSKLGWPKSKHNPYPSMAVDVAPYPIDWKDRERFTYFAGYVQGIARMLYNMELTEHLLRWGGDWSNDTILSDNKFDDLVHWELYKPLEE